MILRSQLRMNKNIVFPFISCIMIMFTLLVLLHKSADELNTARNELSVCKKQHDAIYNQLQNAIEMKLNLEKNVENVKVENKQKLDDLQSLLNREQEKHQKDNDDADVKLGSLNQELNILKTENKETSNTVDAVNKKNLDLEDQLVKIREELKSLNLENDRKEAIITELKQKLKNLDSSMFLKKSTQTNNAPAPEAIPQMNPAAVSSSVTGLTTPSINPMAIFRDEESPKQVGPPPNGEDSPQRKDLRKKLGAIGETYFKENPENVEKAPPAQEDEKNGAIGQIPIAVNLNNQAIMLPPPLIGKNERSSSASNNAVENQDDLPVVAPPVEKEKDKNDQSPKEMKDFGVAAGDYDNNIEDEGEDYEADSKLSKNKKGSVRD